MNTNVYAIGVFDLFHRGHLEFLKNAKALGLNLIVGVNSDEKAAIYKREPVRSELDRLEMVRACKYVNYAFILRHFDQSMYIEKYNIDVMVSGDNWQRSRYLWHTCLTEEYLKEQNTKLLFVPYTHSISSAHLTHPMGTMHAHTVPTGDNAFFYQRQ